MLAANTQAKAQREFNSYIAKQSRQVTRRDPLTWEDRKAIANVLSWDMCKFIAPEEIETIRIECDIVMVYLTNDRLHPIHRDSFKQILQEQKKQAQAKVQVRKQRVTIKSVPMILGPVFQVFVGAAFRGAYCYSDIQKNWIVMHKYQALEMEIRVGSDREAIALLTK